MAMLGLRGPASPVPEGAGLEGLLWHRVEKQLGEGEEEDKRLGREGVVARATRVQGGECWPLLLSPSPTAASESVKRSWPTRRRKEKKEEKKVQGLCLRDLAFAELLKYGLDEHQTSTATRLVACMSLQGLGDLLAKLVHLQEGSASSLAMATARPPGADSRVGDHDFEGLLVEGGPLVHSAAGAAGLPGAGEGAGAGLFVQGAAGAAWADIRDSGDDGSGPGAGDGDFFVHGAAGAGEEEINQQDKGKGKGREAEHEGPGKGKSKSRGGRKNKKGKQKR